MSAKYRELTEDEKRNFLGARRIRDGNVKCESVADHYFDAENECVICGAKDTNDKSKQKER